MRKASQQQRDMGSRALGLVVVLLAAVGCVKNAELGHSKTYQGLGFTVVLRSEVLANADSPGEDSRLYDFHVGSHPLLFAYVGDHPGAPHFSWPGDGVNVVLKSGLTGLCRRQHDSNARRTSRECVFRLGDEFPQLLHIWYDSLDAGLQRTADGTIDSLAASEP
jgi:hypothetical protein